MAIVTDTFEVALHGANLGTIKRRVTPGTTVGDLLQMARVDNKDQIVMIEGRQVEREQALEPRTEVFLVPTVKQSLIGVFTPTPEEQEAMYRRARSLLDTDEIRRRLAEVKDTTGWHTTAEVLERLRSLEAD
jgi:hypothetical protein